MLKRYLQKREIGIVEKKAVGKEREGVEKKDVKRELKVLKRKM